MGKPCYFLRLHGCPVKCPGCDTHYTWDGSEKGKKLPFDRIHSWALAWHQDNPGCGLVVSGGEPLIQYRNTDFADLLRSFRQLLPWVSVETSGFLGGDVPQEAVHFLRIFSTVSLSPKVTPCLHGANRSYEELTEGILPILNGFAGRPRDLFLKFVARDEEDIKVVNEVVRQFGIRQRKHAVYVMPFGQEPEEVLETSKRLIPLITSPGYILTPRLHSLLWGKTRGV